MLQAMIFRKGGHCATTYAACSALAHTGVGSSGVIGGASDIARCVTDADESLMHQAAGPPKTKPDGETEWTGEKVARAFIIDPHAARARNQTPPSGSNS